MTIPTLVRPVDPERPDPAVVAEVARVWKAGGLAAFPTETVYGLGAMATSDDAVRRIFEAKGRPSTNPLIVHVADADRARRVAATWHESARRLADRFWPGPLTLVVPRADGLSGLVSAGGPTVGVRVPDHPVALALLEAVATPIAAPSANRSTRVSPTTGAHVLDELVGRIELIVDAGPTRVGIESTVLDLSRPTPVVLRPGAITAGQIAEVLGRWVDVADHVSTGDAAMASPGQLAVHYAPRTPLVLAEDESTAGAFDGLDPRRVRAIAPGRPVPVGLDRTIRWVHWPTPEEAAWSLYATLRAWDDEGLDRIVALAPPPTEEWRAVRDRLWRASRRWAHGG